MMIRRQLAQDPKLAHEDWSRFLPKFSKRKAKKSGGDTGVATNGESSVGAAAAGAAGTATTAAAAGEEKKKEKKAKKVYTPFPPPQQPSKVREQPLYLFFLFRRNKWLKTMILFSFRSTCNWSRESTFFRQRQRRRRTKRRNEPRSVFD
jgi:hypothetical protein